jgi:hypothetical protein
MDLHNAVIWIPDSRTPNGVAEMPLTPLAVQAFRDQASNCVVRFLFISQRQKQIGTPECEALEKINRQPNGFGRPSRLSR